MGGCTIGSQAEMENRVGVSAGDDETIRSGRFGAAMRLPGVGGKRWARLLALLSAVAVIWLVAGMLVIPRADSATLPTRVVSYTVRPGDTLWAYASAITPEGGDVSRTVDELMALNELDSASLMPGQRIIVPAE